MSLMFTQIASMVGLWLGLALIIFFAEVILLAIFDHRAGNGQGRRQRRNEEMPTRRDGGSEMMK